MVSVVTVVRLVSLATFVWAISRGYMVLWLALFGVSIAGALIFGRVYCGYVCPMNTLIIATERLSQKLGIPKAETPEWLKSNSMPWFSLAVSLVVLVLSRAIAQRNLPILPLWVVAAGILTVRLRSAAFHNYICPFGALQRVVGQFAALTRKVEKSKCVGCNLCEGSCPSDAISVGVDKKAVVLPALCHQCTNCSDVCPVSAVTYGRRL